MSQTIQSIITREHSSYMLLKLFCIRAPTARLYSTMTAVTTKTAAQDFLAFVNASPTPFHAVKSVKERLSRAGFKEIKV